MTYINIIISVNCFTSMASFFVTLAEITSGRRVLQLDELKAVHVRLQESLVEILSSNDTITRLISEAEERENSYSPNFEQLIRKTNKEGQQSRLERVLHPDADSELYLVDFIQELETFKIVLKGTLTKGVRNEYIVSCKSCEGGFKLECNCPDSRNIAAAQKLVCKHRCFVVCRVAKFYPLYYFNDVNHILRRVDVEKITFIFNNRRAIKDFYFVAPVGMPTFSLTSKGQERCNDDEDCAICYEMLGSNLTKVECPTCAQRFHSRCMSVWRATKNTCVVCRSEEWSKWNPPNA